MWFEFLNKIVALLTKIAQDVAAILKALEKPPVVGIEINPGTPATKQGDSDMGVVQVRLSKNPNAVKKAALHAKGSLISSFVMFDNDDDTFTVSGVDAAGNPVDISAVASLTPAPTSDNPSVLTVGPPVGMTFPVAAAGPLGVANVTATATWGDGSLGPFAFTLPVTIQAGAAGGIEIIPGTPSVIQVVPPAPPVTPPVTPPSSSGKN